MVPRYDAPPETHEGARREADLELRPADVHLHEFFLRLNWLTESLRGEGREPPHVERLHLEGLLRRASRTH